MRIIFKQFWLAFAITSSLLWDRAAAQIVQTYAGADFTYQSEGKPATATPVGLPVDVNIDGAGNVYLATLYFQVFRISPAGTMQLVAGNGFRGTPLEGSDARKSTLFDNHSVTPGRDGNTYIGGGGYIVKVTSAGIVNRIAGGGNNFNSAGGGSFSGDGGPAIKAGVGDFIQSIIFDGSGNLMFADARNNRIRKIDTNGIMTTIAGTGAAGRGLLLQTPCH